MKITIEGDVKEIAALVLELQERQSEDARIQLDPKKFYEITGEAIRDTASELPK